MGEALRMMCPECGHSEWSSHEACPVCGHEMEQAEASVRVIDEAGRVVAIRYPNQGIDGTDVEFPVVRA